MFVDVNPADIEQFMLNPIINAKRYIKSGQWKFGGAIIKISLIRSVDIKIIVTQPKLTP